MVNAMATARVNRGDKVGSIHEQVFLDEEIVLG